MIGIMITKEHGKESRKLVNLSFDENFLFLRPDGQSEPSKKISIQSLEINVGGTNDSLLFISSVELSPDSLYFEATKANISTLEGLSLLKDKLKIVEKRRFEARSLGLVAGAVLITLFGLLMFYRQEVFGGLSFLVPFSLEKKIADKVFSPQLRAEQKQLVIQLEGLFSRIKSADSTWKPKYTLHISSETNPNAYATIGGHVFVNKGLILLLPTAEELLGVLAHEQVHVRQRHVLRSVFQGLGVYATLSLLFGDVLGVAAILVDQGGPLLNLKYSRSLEEEADREAIENLKFSGINPLGLPRALEAIQMEVNRLNQQLPGAEVLEKVQNIELLSSHPEMEPRIRNLKRLSADFKEPSSNGKDDFDFEKFKIDIKNNF